MQGILHDLRRGLRSLRRSPGYVIAVILTLALAVGTNTTIFSMVKLVVAPPIPFEDTETLVFPIARNPELNRARAGLSLPDLEDVKERARSIREVAGRRRGQAVLAGTDHPVRVATMELTGGYFRTLGIEPALGRLFLPEELVPGGDRVVLLSHGAWERRFGGDPEVLGRRIQVDGASHTVIGVMPQSLEVGFGGDVELYRPLPRSGAPRRHPSELIGFACDSYRTESKRDFSLESLHADLGPVLALAPSLSDPRPPVAPARPLLAGEWKPGGRLEGRGRPEG